MRRLAFHGGNLKDPLEALRRVGGREFAAIAGAILAARMQKIPVLLDGVVATAAAAVLHAANPASARPLPARQPVAGARPREGRRALLGLRPLLDLGMSHGEGVGAGACRRHRQGGGAASSGMAAALPRG